MDRRLVWRSLTALCFLGLLGASTAQAQSDVWTLRFEAGLAQPLGDYDDFVDPGPSFGAEATYPLADRLGLLVKSKVDLLNNNDFWPVPDQRLWRLQVGVEADLLGSRWDNYAVRVYGAAGSASLETDPFLTESSTISLPSGQHELPRHEFTNHSIGGSAGIRLGFGTASWLSGWLTGEINWSPIDNEDSNIQLLGQATNNTIEPFSSASTGVVTLGFSVKPGS